MRNKKQILIFILFISLGLFFIFPFTSKLHNSRPFGVWVWICIEYVIGAEFRVPFEQGKAQEN